MKLRATERMAVEGVCSRVARTLRFLWADAEVQLQEDTFREEVCVILSTTVNGRQYKSAHYLSHMELAYGSSSLYEHLLKTLPRRHVEGLVHEACVHASKAAF